MPDETDDSTRSVDDQAAAHEADAAGDALDEEGYRFTDADRDKQVLTAEGRQVGRIAAVEDGEAKLRAGPELPGPLREALGVDEAGGEGVTSTLHHEHVENVTDDEVRLRNLTGE